MEVSGSCLRYSPLSTFKQPNQNCSWWSYTQLQLVLLLSIAAGVITIHYYWCCYTLNYSWCSYTPLKRIRLLSIAAGVKTIHYCCWCYTQLQLVLLLSIAAGVITIHYCWWCYTQSQLVLLLSIEAGVITIHYCWWCYTQLQLVLLLSIETGVKTIHYCWWCYTKLQLVLLLSIEAGDVKKKGINKKINVKKLKMKSQERKNVVFVSFFWKRSKIYFFGSYYFNFNFYAVFSKMRQSISTLPVILSFMKFFVAQTSRTLFSSIVVKFKA